MWSNPVWGLDLCLLMTIVLNNSEVFDDNRWLILVNPYLQNCASFQNVINQWWLRMKTIVACIITRHNKITFFGPLSESQVELLKIFIIAVLPKNQEEMFFLIVFLKTLWTPLEVSFQFLSGHPSICCFQSIEDVFCL